MLAPITHVLPLTTIRRERLLPVAGRVVVRRGQKVSATDVVAETNLAPEHLLLDVARGLGMPPARVDKFITRKSGDQVTEGDVIAGPVGIARRVVRTPRPGRVVLVGNGEVLLELDSHPFELRAGMPGTIISLVPDRGVVIENTGALIQGVWGNGQVDFGLLNVLLRSPDDELTPDRLDISMRGSAILVGYCGSARSLEAAAELPVRGLIASSMASNLLPLALRMRYPIVIMEGFGRIPLNAAAYNLLTTNERRETALNAEHRPPTARAEVVIALPATGQLAQPNDTVVFSPNQRLRIIRQPYRGRIGVMVEVRSEPQPLPSGVRAPAALVRLESGEEIVLPLANLEVVD